MGKTGAAGVDVAPVGAVAAVPAASVEAADGVALAGEGPGVDPPAPPAQAAVNTANTANSKDASHTAALCGRTPNAGLRSDMGYSFLAYHGAVQGQVLLEPGSWKKFCFP